MLFSEREVMNPRVLRVIIIALFQLVICTVSAVAVFPECDLDFSRADVTVSGSELHHPETVFPRSFGTRDLVWSEYNFQQQAGIAVTGTGCIIIGGTNGSFAMKLAGIGHADTVQPIQPGVNMAKGKQLDIIRPGYTEWYISRNEGFEQGISITTRPEGTGSLLVSYTLGGDLQQVLDRQTLIFSDSYGPVMQYGGLMAQDANGRVLPSEMRLSGNRLSWQVDDRNAVYPVTIDPYIVTQTAILNASDKAEGANFGNSVSIYTDTAVIGARAAKSYAGQAYIFKDTGGIWSQVAILNASDKYMLNYFGTSVSLYNDIVVIGADGAGSASGSRTDAAGAAYIFREFRITPPEVLYLRTPNKRYGISC